LDKALYDDYLFLVAFEREATSVVRFQRKNRRNRKWTIQQTKQKHFYSIIHPKIKEQRKQSLLVSNDPCELNVKDSTTDSLLVFSAWIVNVFIFFGVQWRSTL